MRVPHPCRAGLCCSALHFGAGLALCLCQALRLAVCLCLAWVPLARASDPVAAGGGGPAELAQADTVGLPAPMETARRVAPVLETDPDSALAYALDLIEGTPLSLDEAVVLALEQATIAREAEAGLRAARGTVRREKGSFDPEVFGEVAASGEDLPTASPFSGAPVLKNEETAGSAGVRMKLPIGTELEASLQTTKLETNSIYATLVPQYDTFGRLEIRQPLLKGFGPAARSELSSAQRTLEGAEARYRDAVLEVRSEVEGVYWDLYAAERDLAVQQLIRDRAQALLTEIDVRQRAGMVGPNQSANARVFLAEQEQALLDREERLDLVSDQMATLLGRRPDDGLPRFRPTDDPPPEFTIEPEDSLMNRAFRRNYLLRAAERNLEAERARARGAKWDALPALDVFGSLGGNGLSGTGREVIFGTDTLRSDLDGGFADTWRQVRKREFPTWSAGVRVSVPLGLREGLGELQRQRAEVDRAEQQVIAARRSLEEQVHASYRELIHGTRRLQAASDGVAAALEQVRIGLLQYRVGQTTAFEIVRLGADLAAAQQRYSQALVRSAKAAAQLRRLTSEESAEPRSN